MRYSSTAPVKIVVIGAGGTGGYVIPHLYRLGYASHRYIRIIVCDGDVVEEKNLSLELDEYMLRLINAFLSGGDYLPHRQIFQKTSLLPGLISQNIKAGNTKRAKEHMTELLKTRDDFFDCMDNPSNKHCLMFIEGDLDGSWNTTKEKINKRVANAEKFLKQI